MKVLYAQKFYVPDTAILLDFISVVPSHAMPLLRDLTVKSIVRNNRTAFSFMQEAKFLNRLRFEQWYHHDDDITKAAKIFWNDALKFLEAIASAREKMTHRKLIEIADAKSELVDTDMAEADAPIAPVASNEEKYVATSPELDTSLPSSVYSEAARTDSIGIKDNSLFNGVVTIPAVAKGAPKSKKEKKQTKYTVLQGKRSDAIDVLDFGDKFLTWKDDSEEFEWDDEMEKEFRETLKAKLQ